MYNCLTVYFKRLTEGLFSERTGMSVVPLRSDVFALCTNLVGRTPKDGRGISQKQVLEQNLSSTDVHGRTSVERYTDVHFWTGYFKRLTESMFSKAVAVCASTSCCTKRIGTGFIYHSCSTFQFLIVRVASSNPCQTMSVRGHCLTSSFCSRKNVATAWNHRPPWRIGAGFIYHSCSFFQFLIVRVASSNPAPMSTIFFPPVLYCAA